jgi:hypothetical protein
MLPRQNAPFQSLRARLILAFLVTVLLPLIGTGLYGNWTTSRTLEAQALENARSGRPSASFPEPTCADAPTLTHPKRATNGKPCYSVTNGCPPTNCCRRSRYN